MVVRFELRGAQVRSGRRMKHMLAGEERLKKCNFSVSNQRTVGRSPAKEDIAVVNIVEGVIGVESMEGR